MQGTRAGSRYAKALIEQAKEQNSLDLVYQDVLTIKEALNNSDELQSFFQSPVVKTEKKKEIVDAIFKGKIQELSLNFLQMITSNKREAALESIVESFIELYNEKNNIARVQVTTATQLSDKMRTELIEKIKENFSFSKVELQESVDKDLIGGMIIRIGDRQLDESIRRKLNDIHQQLINA